MSQLLLHGVLYHKSDRGKPVPGSVKVWLRKQVSSFKPKHSCQCCLIFGVGLCWSRHFGFPILIPEIPARYRKVSWLPALPLFLCVFPFFFFMLSFLFALHMLEATHLPMRHSWAWLYPIAFGIKRLTYLCMHHRALSAEWRTSRTPSWDIWKKTYLSHIISSPLRHRFPAEDQWGGPVQKDMQPCIHFPVVCQGYTSCSSSTPLLFYLERATSGPANYVPGSWGRSGNQCPTVNILS